MKFIKICMLISFVMIILGSTLGCNTIRGMGKDVEKGGQAIQDSTSK